jgi:magnesium-transporting ATPase (P-type)
LRKIIDICNIILCFLLIFLKKNKKSLTRKSINECAARVHQEEVREYNIIIAITFALITTIKFVLAIRGYIKTRKNYDTKTYIFKNITFTSALVSVISLQNVLISSVSDNPKDDAKIFVSTTFLIFGVILLISILSIIKSIKIRKALK